MIRTLIAVLPWALVNAQPPLGGKPQAPPVEVKRVAPGGADVPNLDRYPFTKLIGVLESDPSGKVGVPPSPPAADAPKDLGPARDVPLSETAKEALKAGQAWMTEKQLPAPGKDGRVLYTFGAGLPTIVCAPLRVCVLELEPGEKMNGEPHIGDSVRWAIAPATSGRADLPISMVVIKPKQTGLDTNLLITTDRRAYYVRLISKPEEYLARVAFSYPEGEAAAEWKLHLARQEQQRQAEAAAIRIEPVDALENLYFDYRVVGGDDYMRPVRVVDDGKKTFIQMPAGALVREAPVLVVIGPEGKPEMVNYRVKNDLYIVDRLFERGALLLGVGKKQRKSEIIRGTYRSSPARLAGREGKDPFAEFGEAKDAPKN